MARRTPLFSRHEAAGARFVEFGGFEMPVWYGNQVAEHLRVRTTVGLFDVSHMGEIRVTGPGAAEALSRLVTNEVRDMAVGQARYTPMCNERGGVVDDLVIYRMGEQDFLVCVNAANRDKDFAWMTAHNQRSDATFVDEGDAWVQIAVQGKRAEDTLRPLTPVELAVIASYHQTVGPVAGVEGCIVARTGYTGEPGFEVFVPAEHGGRVWDALLEAGAPYDVAPIGLAARDTLRLEARMPLYGHELTDDLSPLQAKLGRFVKLDKPGGFIGDEALRRRRDEDRHVLAGAVIDGKRIPREGSKVVHEGREVGYVTSGTRSPCLERPVCLFYVERGLDEPGTRLAFDVRGQLVEGEVHKGPFFRKTA